MTVVPGENRMTLICDVCGTVTTGPTCVLPDAEVVWTFVSDHGWSGSPFATGPHRCPRCSPVPSGTTEENPGRGTGGVGGVLGLDSHDTVGNLAADGAAGTDEPIRRALAGATQLGGRVVVDLTGVDVIDSTGLGLLVRAHREARQRGEVLCLAAPSRFIRTVLHTMRLEAVFPIFATTVEALADTSAPKTTDGRAVGVSP